MWAFCGCGCWLVVRVPSKVAGAVAGASGLGKSHRSAPEASRGEVRGGRRPKGKTFLAGRGRRSRRDEHRRDEHRRDEHRRDEYRRDEHRKARRVLPQSHHFSGGYKLTR